MDAAHIFDEVVDTNVVHITDETEITDVEATATVTALIEPYVHIDKEFPRGPSDRSMLT